MLAAVGATIGGTAAAQRLDRLRQIMMRVEERRARQPDDPNATRLESPGDYRFSLVH